MPTLTHWNKMIISVNASTCIFVLKEELLKLYNTEGNI